MIMACFVFAKKCLPVLGVKSLGAELGEGEEGAGGMLMCNLSLDWQLFSSQRRVVVITTVVVFFPCSALFGGVRRTRVDSDRANCSNVCSEVVEARVCDALWTWGLVAMVVESYSSPRHMRPRTFFKRRQVK